MNAGHRVAARSAKRGHRHRPGPPRGGLRHVLQDRV